MNNRSVSNGADNGNNGKERSGSRRKRFTRKVRHTSILQEDVPITATKPFIALISLLGIAVLIQFLIVFSWHHKRHDVHVLGKMKQQKTTKTVKSINVLDGASVEEEDIWVKDKEIDVLSESATNTKRDPATAHLIPHLPPLPPIENTRNIPNSKELISDTLSGKHPTIAGVSLILDNFLHALHTSNKQLATNGKKIQRDEVHEAFVNLAQEHLAPFESTYRNKSIFPIRDDDSIFISLASFRDYLLGDTLMGAFNQAKHPDRLFIGAIIQNCYGLNPYPGEEGVQCRTGAQVVGKNAAGRDQTKVSDAPPDRNGIEEFCTNVKYKKYCDRGQIRVLYLHENESLGPAMARYYASKLWGGETYFMQVDAHLQFYKGWDELYTNEVKATKSYPKAILSSYPPGFQEENGGILDHASSGARLCTCTFSNSDVEAHIIRINSGANYHGDEEHPTQIPFIAAGFFFTPAYFLVDTPFDPYMPWCFMGEEIMLSMRAWTHGWDIYAPRKNWIAHQYRPGRMGLPKFWGSVGRLFGRPGPGFSNQLQLKLIKRVKHLVGYKDCCTREKLIENGEELVLMDVEHYGFGDERSREQYLDWANIDVDANRCHNIKWCNQGELL